MKAIVVDRKQHPNTRIGGLRIQLKGRINGVARKQKRVFVYGKQQQQHLYSLINYTQNTVETKFGVLGLKVQCAREYKDNTVRRTYRSLRTTKSVS